MKRQSFLLWLACMVTLLCIAVSPLFAQSLSKGDGDLRVMTYNVYEGTDYKEVQHARSALEFVLAVGQTIRQVRATTPHQRAQEVAKQIIAARPALISVQELAQWSTGSYDPVTGKCGPVSVESDMLPDLMAALASQGAHYRVAVKGQNWVVPPSPGLILPGTWLCAQVVDHIAILARTDIPSKLQLSNKQGKSFENILMFPTPAGTVPFSRGWVSVDGTFNGRAFRFISTHLDSVDLGIRRLQGEELRLGPANTSLPVIIAMDSNAQAFPFPQESTYLDFLLGGFKDSWSEVRPWDPGLSCCQAQFLNNVKPELYQRVDLILTSAEIKTQRIALFGVTQASKTPDGLWPSDHAGLAAQLVILKGN